MQGLYLLAVGQTKAGLAVGTTTSAALLLLDIKRAMMLVSVLSCSPAHQIPLSPLQGLGFPLLCGSEKPSYGTACERLESCIAIAINEAGT